MVNFIKGTPVPDRPPYIASRYYVVEAGFVSATAAISNKDVIYFVPFQVSPTSLVVVSAVVRLVTGQPGGALKAGVWANSPVTNVPLGAPLMADNTGADCSGAAGDVTIAMSGTLSPGFYWCGVKATADSTLPSFTCWSGRTTTSAMMGISGSNPINAFMKTSSSTYSNDMPTFAEGASFNEVSPSIPVVALRT